MPLNANAKLDKLKMVPINIIANQHLNTKNVVNTKYSNIIENKKLIKI